MVLCLDCEQEMNEAAGCTVRSVRIDTRIGRRIPYRPKRPYAHLRCHDCGVTSGGYHHLGCDMERCPFCRGQLICCECTAEDDDGHEPMLAPVLGREGEQEHARDAGSPS